MPTFAEKLRELRESAGWTQAELARQSGISQKGISQLEQGVNGPMFDTVVSLSAALGVEITAFVGTTSGPPKRTRDRGRPRK